MSATTSLGLDGTVVAQTRLGAIDGIGGRLAYSGYNIHDLATQASWEEVTHLLWHGELPNAAQLTALKAQLADARALSDEGLAMLRRLPTSGHGMDGLRTIVSALGQIDAPLSTTLQADTLLAQGLRLTALVPTLLAAWLRLRAGEEPVLPDPALGHAANLLYMLHGTRPDAVAERALDTYLVLLAEHGLNVSTFVARVVASAQNDLCSAITAAVAALKGVSHGGANEYAMRAFLEIGTPERAAAYIEGLLARKGRLMGVGHRIYKVEDPRVRHLRRHSLALSERPQAQQVVRDGAQAHATAERVAALVLG
ncbi:MAG: citrate synthase, partial [Chloroflexales bacterium]|nr:citrate synthase [Chloroflexales bacterium]